MSEPTSASGKPRWYQINLRTFCVIMLLITVFLSWLGMIAHRGRVTRQAIVAIQASGGRVYTHLPTNSIQQNPWVRSAFGDSTLVGIWYVEMHGEQISDDSLMHLRALQGYKGLVLSQSSITDVGLAQIADQQQLEWLNLEGTAIGDAGLKQLYGLRSLEILDLRNTMVTADGVGNFKQALPKCQVVWEGEAARLLPSRNL